MEDDSPPWKRRAGETSDDVFDRLLAEPYRIWGIERPHERSRVERFDEDVDGYIARRVRTARRIERIGQAQLAAAIGVTQKRLSRIELAQAGARVSELIKLAIQLRKPLAWFVEVPEADRADVVQTGWERVEITEDVEITEG